ncbi:hypothetical protein [Nostoc sp. DedQUE07]|uniref:hypothetical protein n=1 Tax=Nostoc sp. DedQUE07 TaxID=3075392 RepID=UPI002AD3A75B|nr:hypothetical protein [Nostoc sp. DedQUE07]MDZ8131959.1 hypothetical protein [Nostoc sp. DedQUE07]
MRQRTARRRHRPYNGRMNQLQIEYICAINSYILLVFYTPGKCWQFRVIGPDASVYGSQQIFYTCEAAREAGISWVNGDK